MKKRFLPLSMLLITMVLAQASFVANAAGIQGKYNPRTGSKATISSFMKSIRANQETGLIDPADLIAGQKAAQTSSRDVNNLDWVYAGPDNMGGFTRGIIYKNNEIFIGSAGGDIYKSVNGGITFGKIASLDTEFFCPISCMEQDENGNIYIGTGEGRDVEILNGLTDYNYEASFMGHGIYMMATDGTITHLAETTPSATNGWGYVNEIAITNGKIYAATAAGVMAKELGETAWTNLQAGSFRTLKANNKGDVLAADETEVYLLKAGGTTFEQLTGGKIPTNEYPKVIALSESDPNFMYVAYYRYFQTLSSSYVYGIGDIYFTNDNGANWNIAVAGTEFYPIFGTSADPDIFFGYMTVCPNNPRKLLMGFDNLWVVEDITAQGVNSYRPQQISVSGTTSYSNLYTHQGIQNIKFNPSNYNSFMVGTDGGIYKGTYSQSTYKFTGCNRFYITDDYHTATARMMSVGVGGTSHVLGGSLDHGTVHISGDSSLNNASTGYVVFPHPVTNPYTLTNSYFTREYAGGQCAISTIEPNVFFVSGTGALTTPIFRSETAGDDYNQNFEGDGDEPAITNANAFRTPFALYETYNDAHHSLMVYDLLEDYNQPLDTLETFDSVFFNYLDDYYCAYNGNLYHYVDTANAYVLYTYTYVNLNDTLYEVCIDSLLYIYNVLHDVLDSTFIDLDTLMLTFRGTAKAGDNHYYYSKSGGYPITYVLTEPPHDEAHVDTVAGGYQWIATDTIRGMHDSIRTTYVCAVESGVYMTRDALVFDKTTDWFLMSKVSGIPTTVKITSDGTIAYVGTNSGAIYKFTNINDVFTAEQANVEDSLNICVQMFVDSTSFANRVITDIAINPSNNNDILVTLGNYGNTDYVYRSSGTGYVSVQGTLPQIPVYSCLIEKSDEHALMVGTEYGIYVSLDGATWTKSGNVNCPVMEIRQAIMPNHPDRVEILLDEMNDSTYVYYKGISNEGMIYAATYGEGIVSCGEYAVAVSTDNNDDNNDITTVTTEELNVYPNPVKGTAQVNIKLDSNSTVSYVIYDLSGRVIEDNNLGTFVRGSYTLNINTNDLPTGSYIIRINAGDKSETGKFLVY